MDLDEIAQKQRTTGTVTEQVKKTDVRNYIIVALATALIVLGLVWLRDSGTSDPTGGFVAPSAQPSPAAPRAPVDMRALVDDDPALGDKNAPITMVEFSDFQCPFCGRFFTQTLSQIKANYIDKGKVRFVYRDFPLDSIHAEATPAAIAANCAGEQGKFWEFHDQIFENQASLSAENYKKWSTALKLDATKFNDCINTKRYASEVRKDFADGSAAGVTGTPAFFINGQLVSGAQPYAVFEQLFEKLLADNE